MSMMLLSAIAMGFLGSPHCLGMCGGIVTAFGIAIKDSSPKKRAMLIGTYHVGRLISYMALGLVVSLFGEHVVAKFLLGNATPRILLGLAVVFASLLMLGVPFLSRLEKIGLGLWQTLAPVRQKVFPMNTMPKALLAGLLWGFLPCGMVYGALVMAVSVSATYGSLMGVMVMLAFGLGTLPMLVMTGTALSWLQQKVKAFNLRRFSGAIMLVSGVFIMMYNGGGHHHDHAHAHHAPMLHEHDMSETDGHDMHHDGHDHEGHASHHNHAHGTH